MHTQRNTQGKDKEKGRYTGEEIQKDPEMEIEKESKRNTHTHKEERKKPHQVRHHIIEQRNILPQSGLVYKLLCLNAAFLQVHYSVDITSGLMEKLLLDTQNETRCQLPRVKQDATKICVFVRECVHTGCACVHTCGFGL